MEGSERSSERASKRPRERAGELREGESERASGRAERARESWESKKARESWEQMGKNEGKESWQQMGKNEADGRKGESFLLFSYFFKGILVLLQALGSEL